MNWIAWGTQDIAVPAVQARNGENCWNYRVKSQCSAENRNSLTSSELTRDVNRELLTLTRSSQVTFLSSELTTVLRYTFSEGWQWWGKNTRDYQVSSAPQCVYIEHTSKCLQYIMSGLTSIAWWLCFKHTKVNRSKITLTNCWLDKCTRVSARNSSRQDSISCYDLMGND